MSEPRRKRLKKTDCNSSTYDSCEIESEATCGIIQNVTVKNFMCHEHLSVDFKERINVVQGRNGSGKSAILTAVVVALGGTTKITNRGSSFKDLIKYDKHTATVTISLKNEGRDAYKPEIYGTSINIERKIMDSGATSYCLKNASGKVVSMKREELKRLCDYFNLIVENPLMVLNQDMSRSFLNSLDPGNLYKFFYQATQLQQMTDSYNILNECLETTAAMIKDRDSIFSTIERELQEVNNQHQFCLKQESKRMKLKDLRKELVWARISEIENEKNEVERELSKVVSVMSKSEEKQRLIEEEVKKSTQKYQECMKKFEDLTNEIKSERQSYKEKSAAQSQAKCKWKDIQRELDKEVRRIQVMNREIEVLDSTIKRDFTEVQRAWDEHNKQHKEEIAKVQAELVEMEQVKKTDETHLANIQHTLNVKMDHLQQLKIEENMNNRKIKDLEQELKTLRSRHTNSFSVFGTWVQPLLEKIEVAFRQKKFSAKPVGPLGAYIEMKDNRWTHIAEMVIGSKMSAFCVNSDNDAKVLRSLFQGIHFGPAQPTIISCKFRPRFSQEKVSRFEVHCEKYPSLWAVMNITNDVVANLILDRNQVETVMLIPTANEAGQILKNVSTVPNNCKIAYTLNCDKYFPDPNYKVYSGAGQRPARFLQVSVGERAMEVSRDIQNLKDAIKQLGKSAAEIQSEISELKRQERVSNDKIKAQRMQIQKLRATSTHLMNQVEPPQPPNVTQIEEDKREQEERRNVALEKVNSLKEDVKSAEKQYREADEIFSKFNNQISELSQTAHSMEKEMTEAEEEYHKWTNQLKAMKKKHKQVEQMKVELEKKTQSQAEKFSAELLMAEKFLPRKETNRSPIQIEREYKTLEVKLNKEQTSHGDPVKIAEKLKEMTEKYKKLKAELQESKNLIGKLKKSLGERWLMGRNFRKVVSIVVKTSFVEILSGRKLRGKLLFDFENETLTIQLAKNDGYTDISVGDNNTSSKRLSQKRNQQEKLSMMSGGERSFCTVALILALWEVMDSPIRMLDEFDVFMDIVARRQSLDMMITHAKPKTQYIYLTPLEVNGGHIQEGVNIFRMPDPERT
ncbi:structural maintenance of chromosomes protein 6 isoform X2 [Palaemon carinicauda]|uniref:structural maintenance of chromosomes protein 6 isoform X2 n=1 Tax=Palaemon carinicauda TaxID=392227 RepID=UPI0035B5AB16